MADPLPPKPKIPFSERAKKVYHAALGERPLLVWWLVSPTLLGTAIDVWLRHGTLRYFPPRQWLNYFGSSLVSAGFWGGALWMFAVLLHDRKRWGRVAFAFYVALFVLPFSFFAYGGQIVYFKVFDSFIARDTIRLGLELRGTVGEWMGQWASKLWPAAFFALVVLGLVLTAVRRAGASLKTAVPLVPMVAFLGSCVALWQDFVETKGLQAAPPDSCFLHGVVGMAHERLVSTGPPKGLSIRRPAPLPAMARPEHRPSVVLVVTESVRRDVLCSKPGACEARYLDEVAKERIGFSKMTTQASGTFSACMILWTGLGPDADFKAVHEAPFLWEVAKAQGYRTGYFSSQNLRYRDLGVYLRVGGIDTLVSATELGDTKDPHLGAPDERAMDRMLSWVGDSKEPYFAVLHLSNTHWPYRVDPALQPFEPHDEDPLKSDVRLLFNHYRNSVLMQERSLSRFLKDLKSRPSWDDTALFFVSDHGEQFREHGRLYHLNNIFEEEVRVPGFVLFGKDAINEAGASALHRYEERRVYGDDLNATIVDLLGGFEARPTFAHAARLGGRSLIRPPIVRGEPVVAASTTSGVWVDNDPVYGVIWGDWKAVGDDATPWACFNLLKDPSERSAIPASECPSLVREAARHFPHVPTQKNRLELRRDVAPMNLFSYLGLALLGGLVLNVMPCVLPVLTLKAFTVFEHSTRDPKSQRVAGIGYAVGTMSALSVLGGVIVVIRASGKAFGWGMQFQQPAFVATLIAVIVGFALNALGVFEIEVGGSHEEKGGFFGAVLNGWFAAVMATPCSAPFLGSAAAFALAADTPAWVTILVFAVIGLGLALPFTLLTYMPWLSKRLPKPGPWMDTFKKLMGFSLLATAVWLLGTFLRQVTPESARSFIGYLLGMSFVLWLMGTYAGLDAGHARRWGLRLFAAVVTVGGLFALPFDRAHAGEVAQAGDAIKWSAFDPKKIETELAAGRPVFLDYTADWCASCKTNDKLFVDTPKVREALARTNVVAVKVDMTNEDDVKEAWLKKTGRNDLPVYVVFMPGGQMDLLPVVITSDTLTDAFDRAAKKHPPKRTN